jgi:hypothetical protein
MEFEDGLFVTAFQLGYNSDMQLALDTFCEVCKMWGIDDSWQVWIRWHRDLCFKWYVLLKDDKSRALQL